jgi:signal transduction histidine kinase
MSKLIQNSIKFTKKGFIEFGYYKENNHFHFYVKDSGIGIPEHALESIFNNFIQADMNRTRIHEGIGLGLSIAKALVEKLGGTIWIESIENEYTTFHFTLR